MSKKKTKTPPAPAKAPAVIAGKKKPAAAYDPAANSAGSYAAAIDAIRMEGVKAGRFLPLPDRPDEIKASPIVERVVRVGEPGRPMATLFCGDSTRVIPLLAEQGNGQGWIDACVTDPPYELGFMGKSWDSSGVAAEWKTWGGVRIALKPGAHLVAFAGSRTYHRIAQAIDLAGFEVRDQLMWIYGSGFPKSRDVAKDIDKMDAVGSRHERALRFTAWMRSTGIKATKINKVTGSNMGSHYLTEGEQPEVATREMFEKLRPHLPDVPPWVEELVNAHTVESENLKRRPVVGMHEKEAQAAAWRGRYQGSSVAPAASITRAFTEEAQRWEGWGTALKPAHEPVCFARKPLSEKTIAENVLRWATGAINVDAARPEYRDSSDLENAAAAATARLTRDTAGRERWAGHGGGAFNDPEGSLSGWNEKSAMGRWPANVTHDASFEVLEAFPPSARDAIRFFYAPKADKADRDFGLANMEKKQVGMIAGADREGPLDPVSERFRTAPKANVHPTVKPVDLMRWLCRLVTPSGGVVLDPFMGSGSTGIAAIREGMSFVGCEMSPDYFEIAHARISAAVEEAKATPNLVDEITRATQKLKQQDLF